MTTERTVYLAGPVTNKTGPEAKVWRADMCARLLPYGIIGISPVRCEPPRGVRYTVSNNDARFGTARAIASKNLYDVRNCDMTLAYLPMELHADRPSYGTIGEIFWANGAMRPTILVTDVPVLREHPVIQAAVNWLLDDLDQAAEVIIGMLGAYTGVTPPFVSDAP